MNSKWVRVDRRYNNPYRLTGYAYRKIFLWGGLAITWSAFLSAGNWFALMAMAGLTWLALGRPGIRRGQAQALPHPPQVAAAEAGLLRFNPPPGWPPAPIGWTPAPGWQPDPAWPPLPPGWPLWIEDVHAPLGERNTRHVPQDVKIAVAARDSGRCRQCGSAEDLHFDHVIPWSRGGANTISNIQLLCGPCNRRKGADDIPAIP